MIVNNIEKQISTHRSYFVDNFTGEITRRILFFFSFFAFLFFFVLSSSAVLSPLRRGVDRAEKTFDSSVIVDPISRPSSNDTHLAHEQSRRRTFSFNVLFFIYFSLSTIPNVPPFHFYTPTIFCAFSA